MDDKLFKLFDEMLVENKTLSLKELSEMKDALVAEMQELCKKLDSTDPEVKAEAIYEAALFKKMVQKQVISVCEKAHLNPLELCMLADKIVEDQPGEKGLLDEMKQELDALSALPKKEKRRRRKSKGSVSP